MAEAAPRPAAPPLRVPRLDLSVLIWAGAVLVLGFLVVVPLAWLLLASFQDDFSGALTLQNFAFAFGHRIYLEPIRNSFLMAVVSACVATAVGTPLAWLVSRTDLPGRQVLRPLILAAFVTPSFLGAVAWIFLAAPNSGLLNRLWVAALHAEHGPLNIFSLQGCMFVIAIYSIPYTFSLVSGALELMSSEMEDAATTLGAGTFRTALQITLPLALPAILAGFVLSFLEALELFGPPAFLLIPARQQVMTTQLYLFFSDPVSARVNVAAAYALPLLLVTAALLLLQRRIIGRRRFTTVTGKGGVRRRMRLGRWRWPLAVLAFVAPTLSVLLPYLGLALVSLSRAWGRGVFAPGNFGLYWYRWAIWENATTRVAIAHSLEYGAVAATIAVVVATLVAFIVVRAMTRWAQVFGFVAMAPFVVPGIVLAIGFFAAYTRPPLILYGTAGIMIAAYATRFLPIAYSNAHASLQGIGVDLENAARTLGAGRLRSLLEITAPLLRRGILTGWLLVFIPSLRELSASVFLFTPQTHVITTVIFDFSDAGNYEAVSTMGLLMMLITFVIVIAAYRLFGREFGRRERGA